MKVSLTTNLHMIRHYRACVDRYHRLKDRLGPGYKDLDPINLLTILDLGGVTDCLWALRASKDHPQKDKVIRSMAADFAELVLPFYEQAYQDDGRPRKAVEAARRYARRKISRAAMKKARDDAWDAAVAHGLLGNVAAEKAATAAAWSTAEPPWLAAWCAAEYAAEATAWAAASGPWQGNIGGIVYNEAADWAAAAAIARDTQGEIIRRYLDYGV